MLSNIFFDFYALEYVYSLLLFLRKATKRGVLYTNNIPPKLIVY